MKKKTAIVCTFLLFIACSYAQVQAPSFQSFWKEFRAAVLSGDELKIADLTQFPFEIRGPSDYDPVRRLNRRTFIKSYHRLVEEPVYSFKGDQLVKKTMGEIIADQSEITAKENVSNNFSRIENFEFQRVNGKWLFTRAYMEDL